MQALHRDAFPIMGTTASVHINDQISPAEFAGAIEKTKNELTRLEKIFSVFREDSEISRINRGELHLLDASSEVIDVMDKCSWLEQITNGAFSVRRSRTATEINPSGFVKGWAGERVASLLGNEGFEHFYVDIGGDFMAYGGMTNDSPWCIGITDPRDVSMFVGTVDIMTGAVATSGTAERGGHIWDPRVGEVAQSFLSVTVTGPSLMWADAFATSIFVMGDAGEQWLQQFDGYSMMAVPAA